MEQRPDSRSGAPPPGATVAANDYGSAHSPGTSVGGRLRDLVAECGGGPRRRLACSFRRAAQATSGSRSLRRSGGCLLSDSPGTLPCGTPAAPRPSAPGTAPSGLGSAPSRPPRPTDPDSAFTAVHPGKVHPLAAYTLLVFAHRTRPFHDEFGTVKDPFEVIHEQAMKEFPEAPSLMIRTALATSPLAPGLLLTITVSIDCAQVWPESQVQELHEPVQRHLFRFRFDQLPADGVAHGEVVAMVGPVVLAVVPIAIEVSLSTSDAAELRRTTGRTYRKIFASYSHEDEPIVADIERAVSALGIDYLRDVNTLRSGDPWNDRLLALIEEADLFQLFWSWNSMRSPHVRREWEHALSLRRQDFVRPVRWEDPLPSDEDAQLPPEELKRLHFHHYVPASGASSRPPATRLDDRWLSDLGANDTDGDGLADAAPFDTAESNEADAASSPRTSPTNACASCGHGKRPGGRASASGAATSSSSGAFRRAGPRRHRPPRSVCLQRGAGRRPAQRCSGRTPSSAFTRILTAAGEHWSHRADRSLAADRSRAARRRGRLHWIVGIAAAVFFLLAAVAVLVSLLSTTVAGMGGKRTH